MPKYQITGVGHYVYYFVLNSMMANAEQGAKFGPFDTKELARAAYDAELVEPYSEEGPDLFDYGNERTTPKMYRKVFRKGGWLEHFNPLEPHEWETPGIFGHGLYEVLDNVTNVVKGPQVY